MKKELQTRKATRLKEYDYSLNGAYFVTICTYDRKQILSNVLKKENAENDNCRYVVSLKPCGRIAEDYLLSLADRFDNVELQDYVIMPDHIHIIILLKKRENCKTPASLDQIIRAFKSLTSKECNKNYNVFPVFQRSFSDHIIRDKEDYEIRRNYMYENPVRWYYKHINE